MNKTFHSAQIPSPGDEPEIDPPSVVSFTMADTAISTGQTASFSIKTENALYVQLIVDGEYYDTMPVVSETTVLGRRFTLSGNRQVSFRAYGNGMWSEPCAVQILTVTAEGTLTSPSASCNGQIRLGEALTVSWSAVEHADGYVLYLNYPDGTSQGVGQKLSASTLSYTYPANEMAVPGDYSVRVMAYGAGYSQSSVLVQFHVTNEYTPWEGWPQRSKVNTYDSADSTTANGYVDYLDPVTVLEEEGDCYLIEMTLTAGGTAQRYVRKSDIGLSPFVPGLTLSVSFARGENGELYLYASTNLVGCKAGVMHNSDPLGTLYSPTKVKQYTNIYAFNVPPVTGSTTYTLWAEDASGNRLTKNITITISETTPAPEITATPVPTSTPAPETTVTPTPIITPTITPTITPAATPSPEDEIIVPEETLPVEPDDTCSYATASGHSLEYILLKDMCLVLYDDGRIRVNTATCPECGGTISDFGFVPETVQTQFYFHPVARYYDTSANGQNYSMNHDYKSVVVNEDLTISKSIDLNGAPLIVNGVLRVDATLSGVSEIRCSELIVESNGVLQAGNVQYLVAERRNYASGSSTGGKIEIKEGGKISLHPDASILCGGNMTINGYLQGGKTVNCSSLSVGSNGTLGLSDAFVANINGDFNFKSSNSHSSCFGADSVLNVHGDIRISGDQFSFNGTCYLKGKNQLIKMDNNNNNYFNTLDMTEGGAMLTVNKEHTELVNNNWNDSNSFRTNNLEGCVIDSAAEAVVEQFFDFILIDPIKSGTGFAALEGAADFIKPLLTKTTKQPDRQAYEQLLFKAVGDTEKEVDPATVVTGVIGITSFDSDTAKEADGIIRYALMNEMFFKRGTHVFDFSGFSLNFSMIEGDSFSFLYNEKWYTIEIEGISMKTSTQGVEGEIYFLSGELIHSNNKRTRFSYTTNLQELNDAALLLQAAGCSEVVAELRSLLEDIVSSAKKAVNMLDMFDEVDYKKNLKSFVYKRCPIRIQEFADWVEWVDGEFNEHEKQLFKDFKKFYDLSLLFYPPQAE